VESSRASRRAGAVRGAGACSGQSRKAVPTTPAAAPAPGRRRARARPMMPRRRSPERGRRRDLRNQRHRSDQRGIGVAVERPRGRRPPSWVQLSCSARRQAPAPRTAPPCGRRAMTHRDHPRLLRRPPAAWPTASTREMAGAAAGALRRPERAHAEIRAAATKAGDSGLISLWAGQGTPLGARGPCPRAGSTNRSRSRRRHRAAPEVLTWEDDGGPDSVDSWAHPHRGIYALIGIGLTLIFGACG